jgi:hypothetical protein
MMFHSMNMAIGGPRVHRFYAQQDFETPIILPNRTIDLRRTTQVYREMGGHYFATQLSHCEEFVLALIENGPRENDYLPVALLREGLLDFRGEKGRIKFE